MQLRSSFNRSKGIIFEKECFINTQKISDFIQSLTNKKKVIKSITAFHNDYYVGGWLDTFLYLIMRSVLPVYGKSCKRLAPVNFFNQLLIY